MVKLTIFAIAAVVGLIPAPQSVPSSRVSVYVSVVDAAGRPITDLQAGDFEIRDRGKPRPVEAFVPSVASRSVVVLLDVSTSMTAMLDQLLFGAEAVLTQLPPEDRVRLGTFSGTIQLGPVITGSRRAAIQALRQGLRPGGPSRLYDAVFASMEVMASEPDRRLVLVMTDGDDTTSRQSFDDLVKRAQAEDQAVFAMAFDEMTPGRFTFPSRTLMRLAAETGGGYVEWRSGGLNQAAGQLIGQLRSEYRLEFTPVELDGKRHKLEVVVKRKGVRVRARPSFIAGRSGT